MWGEESEFRVKEGITEEGAPDEMHLTQGNKETRYLRDGASPHLQLPGGELLSEWEFGEQSLCSQGSSVRDLHQLLTVASSCSGN